MMKSAVKKRQELVETHQSTRRPAIVPRTGGMHLYLALTHQQNPPPPSHLIYVQGQNPIAAPSYVRGFELCDGNGISRGVKDQFRSIIDERTEEGGESELWSSRYLPGFPRRIRRSSTEIMTPWMVVGLVLPLVIVLVPIRFLA